MKQYMNKKELAIADISDAELVKYYFLPDGVLGLLVISGSKVFNLSAEEKYFENLEQAALRAYCSRPHVAADEFTREILENRSAAALSPIFSEYENLDGTYEKTLPFEKNKVGTLLSMMEYYLQMIYERLGFSAAFPSEIKGYRKNYSLNFRLNNERKTIPFSYTEWGDGCETVFANFPQISDKITISVKYSFGIISVTADVRCKKHIRTENTFDILRKTETLRIFDETDIVYNNSKPIQAVPCHIPSEIIPISKSERFEALPLPFGTAFISKTDKKSKIITYQKSQKDTAAFIFHSEREYSGNDKSIVTDSMTAAHEIFYSDNKKTICTHFLPTGTFSKGIYKQKYENRYFYRTIE